MTLADLDIRTIVLLHPDGCERRTTVFCGQYYGIAQPIDHAVIIHLQRGEWLRLMHFNRLEDAVPAIEVLDNKVGPNPTIDGNKYVTVLQEILHDNQSVMCLACVKEDMQALEEEWESSK